MVMVRVTSLLVALAFSAAAAGCGNVDTSPSESTDTPAAPAQPDGDADQDGIPDSEDAVPCAAFRLVVANVGVDQAEISLNGESVVLAGAFPTNDVISVFLDVAQGANSIEVATSLTGAERLHIMVESGDKTTRFVDETITSASALSAVAFGFDISVACEGY